MPGGIGSASSPVTPPTGHAVRRYATRRRSCRRTLSPPLPTQGGMIVATSRSCTR
jgi:hypothetical protein